MTRLLLTLLTLLLLAPAAHAAPSCTRGGHALVKRAKQVAVVKQGERVFACWRATGRRFSVGREYDEEAGSDNRVTTFIRGRHLGVVQRGSSEVKGWQFATVFDVRSRRARLRTEACGSRGDFEGIDHVVFLRSGGMAYACGALYLHRAPAAARERLEPAGVTELAIEGDRLVWVAGGVRREQDL